MFEGLSLSGIVSIVSVFLAVGYQMFIFSKLKKKMATKEGREYIASKGGKALMPLYLGIMLTVILLIFVIILKINLGVTVALQICVWTIFINLQRKLSK